MEIKQNETNKYYEVLSNPFFTICDFHASTDVRMELLFQIVKIFIRIYHHMAHSNSMEYLFTFFRWQSLVSSQS